MARIEFLTGSEIKNFESVPEFKNSFERDYFFKLPKKIYDQALTLGNDELFCIFTLMYGYFKVSNKFFDFNGYNEDDIRHICTKYQIEVSNSMVQPSIRTIQRYKQIIKFYFQIIEFNSEIESKLQQHAIELASNFTHRKKIFYSLVDYSKKLTIEIPSYFTLSKIISAALNNQTENILSVLKTYKNDERLKLLGDFTDKDENFKNRYNIGSYKKLGHSTNKKQMLTSLTHLETIRSKFTILKPIIDEVGITDKISQYYSKWLEQSKVLQLTRKQELEQQFLLLSFVKYQYYIRNDNLVDRFIAIIQSTKNTLLRHQKDLHFQNEPKQTALITSLENANISILNEVSQIINSDTIDDTTKISTLKSLINSKTQALKSLFEEKTTIEKNHLNRFDFLHKASQSLQGKFSGVVKLLEFDEKSSNKHLIKAIRYFKENGNLTKLAPTDFLSEEEKTVLLDDEKKFRVSLYKALLFIHISDGIRSGILNLKYSYKYKSFEDYLIPKDEFFQEKKALFAYYELDHLENFSEYIDPINKKLEHSFEITNRRIIKDNNTHFKATADSFILSTPKLEKTEEQLEHTIAKYFPQAELISVIDLLHSVQVKTDFLDSFKHYSLQNTRIGKLDPNLLYASIVGYGCNISLSKMAKISKGISENELDTTTTWYLNEKNTIEANDKIVAYIDSLEISKLFKANQDINHTSSDGQKYNIKSSIDSTNAGWSHKYFGLDKGVVAYTFIDEGHKLFYSIVINVNERESGYVIDGCLPTFRVFFPSVLRLA